jgi:hypothetical protein
LAVGATVIGEWPELSMAVTGHFKRSATGFFSGLAMWFGRV